MSSIDQQFVEYIAKSLVSKPDDVSIERRIDEKGVLLELTVNPEDLGRVIGKHGATAQSLRTLLRALGTKNDARYNLKIVDTDMPQENQDRREQNSEESVKTPTFTPPPVDDVKADEEPSVDDEAKDEEQPQPAETEEPAEAEHSTSSVVDKTRAELAELDDLDV